VMAGLPGTFYTDDISSVTSALARVRHYFGSLTRLRQYGSITGIRFGGIVKPSVLPGRRTPLAVT
jgi:hypothetical protein